VVPTIALMSEKPSCKGRLLLYRSPTRKLRNLDFPVPFFAVHAPEFSLPFSSRKPTSFYPQEFFPFFDKGQERALPIYESENRDPSWFRVPFFSLLLLVGRQPRRPGALGFHNPASLAAENFPLGVRWSFTRTFSHFYVLVDFWLMWFCHRRHRSLQVCAPQLLLPPPPSFHSLGRFLLFSSWCKEKLVDFLPFFFSNFLPLRTAVRSSGVPPPDCAPVQSFFLVFLDHFLGLLPPSPFLTR